MITEFVGTGNMGEACGPTGTIRRASPSIPKASGH